jgi:hypothetical protein
VRARQLGGSRRGPQAVCQMSRPQAVVSGKMRPRAQEPRESREAGPRVQPGRRKPEQWVSEPQELEEQVPEPRTEGPRALEWRAAEVQELGPGTLEP